MYREHYKHMILGFPSVSKPEKFFFVFNLLFSLARLCWLLSGFLVFIVLRHRP